MMDEDSDLDSDFDSNRLENLNDKSHESRVRQTPLDNSSLVTHLALLFFSFYLSISFSLDYSNGYFNH